MARFASPVVPVRSFEVARIDGTIFKTMKEAEAHGRERGWIKDVRNYSCGSSRPYVDLFDSHLIFPRLPGGPIEGQPGQ